MFSLFKPFFFNDKSLALAFLQRVIVFLLIFSINIGLLPPVFPASLASAQTPNSTVGQDIENEAQVQLNLVAILADKKLLADGSKYKGLADDYPAINSVDLKKRVQRYADDVQKTLPFTKALVIEVDSESESVFDIASTLEKLYFDGDGAANQGSNNLVGVVVIGDVPLPVVNKNGNRFISMLPYTDFHEKSYIYNPDTGDFESDNRVNFPRSEIWHGIIQAPAEIQDEASRQEALAVYLDKNHLYHIGNKDFAEFEKALLISDLFHERRLMNTGFFTYYQKFIESAEDRAYWRYNKHWAEDLYTEFVGDIVTEAGDVLQDGYAANLNATIEQGLFANIPDIHTKQAIIEKYSKNYVELFTNYLSQLNDWVDYSGRYSKAEVQSIIEIISTKDVYNGEYLRLANNLIEEKVDAMVQKGLQKRIPIVSHSTLTGAVIIEKQELNDEGDIITIEEKLPFTHKVREGDASFLKAIIGALFLEADDFNHEVREFNFLNHSLITYAKDIWPKATTNVNVTRPPEPEEDEEQAADAEIAEPEVAASFEIPNVEDKFFINGVLGTDIRNPLDCSLYRGSTQITYNNRIFNKQNTGDKLFLGVNTKPFFNYQGYDFGLAVMRDESNPTPAVIQDSPAWNAGIQEGDIILQINGIDLNKPGENGARLILEDILPKLDADNDKIASIKYYDLSKKQEVGPVNVTLENQNNLEWSAGCHGINGLEVDGTSNPNKCVPQLSNLPVFDPAAAKEVSVDELFSGDNIDETHIRSCYDFYYNEEPRFKKLALFADPEYTVQPFVQWLKDFDAFSKAKNNIPGQDYGNQFLDPTKRFTPTVNPTQTDFLFHTNPETLVLYDQKGIKLTFADLLVSAGAFDGIDNDEDGQIDEEDENDPKYAINEGDWAEIGQKILSREGTFRFKVPKLSNDVEISIHPNVVNWTSSMIPHREPYSSTIAAQARSQATESLPIDHERYLAFVDQNGVLQRIDYPNLFDASSFEDFQIKLFKLSRNLATMPGSENLLVGGGASGLPSEDVLTKLIFDKFMESFSADNDIYQKDSLGFDVLKATSKDKVSDAVTWNAIGIDDKHSYVLSNYLDPSRDAYADEKNGYEALYFISDGEADFASYAFYGDYPASALDNNFEFASDTSGSDSGEDFIGVDGTSTSGGSTGLDAEQLEDSAKKLLISGIPLWEWFPAIIEWIDETTSNLKDISAGGGIGLACKANPNASAHLLDEDTPVASENLRLARLEISLEKDVLQANATDDTTLLVKSLNSAGELITSNSLSKVEILISSGDKKIVVTDFPSTQIVDGLATFHLTSTLQTGKATIQVATTNTSQRILSNPLTIDSTLRSIVINSFDITGTEGSDPNLSSNSMLADGASTLRVTATILDENNEPLRTDSSTEIEFNLEPEGQSSAVLGNKLVTASNGSAETRLDSTTVSGMIKITAVDKSGALPPAESDIFVLPGALNKIEILPQSAVVKTGGLSYTPVRIQFVDSYGNIKNDEVFRATVWHDGPGQFRDIQDQDLTEPGIQVMVAEGYIDFLMSSTNDAGEITIHAETILPTIGDEIGNSFYGNAKISSRNDLSLSILPHLTELKADGQSQSLVELSVQDNNGIVPQANLPLSVELSPPSLAELTGATSYFFAGKAFVNLKSRTVSGEISLVLSSPGFDDALVSIPIKALDPYKVQFITPKQGLVSDSQSTLQLEAVILDVYGNHVKEDQETEINFAISESTSNVAEFLSSQNLHAKDGKVVAVIKSTLFSGPVRIMAKGVKLGEGDEIEIFSQKRFPSESLKNSNADVLFATLLGNSFGDPTRANALGNSMLFHSATEAIASTTTPMKQFKTSVAVSANSKIDVDKNNVNSRFSVSKSKISSDMVNLTDSKTGLVLAEISVVLPDYSKVHQDEDPNSAKDAGVYLSNLIDYDAYSLETRDDSTLLLFDHVPNIEINNRGQINVLSGSYTIKPALSDMMHMSFDINSAGKRILTVTIVPESGHDVHLIKDPSFVFPDAIENGVYLIDYTEGQNYVTEPFFSGNSTHSSKGLSLKNKSSEAASNQLIGGPYLSLDGAFDQAGVGFTGQNKHMLLFFAGNHAGASFMPYSSEAGIILGDPTVKIDNTESSDLPLYDQNSGFTQDLGQSVFTDSNNAESIEVFDYNSDGIDDVLIAYASGDVRLLEGVKSSLETPFRDKGWVLSILNGILDMTLGDVNHDGQTDIIVATKESCNKDETCVYYYINDNGHFIQQHAGLNLTSKVSDLEVADLNNDGLDDLVLTDLNRTALAFYGNAEGINTQGQRIGGLEPEVDEGINASHQTFISYARSEAEKAELRKESGIDPFITLELPSNNPTDSSSRSKPISAAERQALADLAASASNGADITIPAPRGFKSHDFLPLDTDKRTNKSLKVLKDLNGGKLEKGDLLEYSISIVNSGPPIYNASILDYVPEDFSVSANDITCEGCGVAPSIIPTGMPSRPFLVSGLNLGTGGVLKIKYKSKSGSFPPLKLIIGEGLDEYPDDEYVDILIHPDGVPTNRAIYYSDTLDTKTGYMVYKELFPEQLEPSLNKPLDTSEPELNFTPAGDDTNNNGIPDTHEGIDEDSSKKEIEALLPGDDSYSSIEDYFNSTRRDDDLDGVPDNLDSLSAGLAGAASSIENIMNSFKCTGGCFPMPINQVLNVPFPVPGNINLFGVQGPFIPGIPIFSINKPNTLAPPAINTPIWPAGNPFYFDSIFRMYMSPTLTGGLGTALCIGEYAWTDLSMSNQCFIFSIPLLQALGVCKALTGGISGALNGATAFASGKKKPSVIISNGSNPNLGGSPYSNTGFSSGPFSTAPNVSRNVRLPGFPSVITNWFDRQTEEIVDKLTDLPDIYLIIPDSDSVVGSFTPGQDFKASNLDEVVSYLNSIPILQVEKKPVVISFPWISQPQIGELLLSYKHWMRELETEFNNLYKSLGCESQPYNQICQELKAEYDNLFYAAQKNVIAFQEFGKLPQKISNFRNIESQYVSQIICYTDTLVEYSSAYMKRQQLRINSWEVAIKRIQRMLKDWAVIMDVSVSYAESCDACKNDKFSLLELMLRLLVVVPDPPIIELPKWPDIVLDVSQIQSGLTVVIPDIEFVPEPVIIPDLPSIDFSNIVEAIRKEAEKNQPSQPTNPEQPDLSNGTDSTGLPDTDIANIPALPNVKIDLPPFPSIPEIPNPTLVIPDLPTLPPLPLPSLPDLPPPPDIPELPKPVVKLAQTFNVLFKIFCLVKQGIMSLPEPKVATEIEALTQRSNSPILPAPFDMSAAFQLPPINYSYVDQIEIVVKLNLQLDFDALYEVVQKTAATTNTLTTFGVQKVNTDIEKALLEISGAKEDISKPGLYETLEGTVAPPSNPATPSETEGEPSAFAPSLNNNLASYFDADIQDLLNSEVSNLDQTMKDYREQVAAINAYSRSVPEKIELAASVEMIDPASHLLHRNVEDIKALASLRDESLASAPLVALRDGLIAHHDNLIRSTKLLDSAQNSEQFIALLQSNNPRLVLADNSLVKSSASDSTSLRKPIVQKVTTQNDSIDESLRIAKKLQNRIIALTDDSPSSQAAQGGSPKGMFIYDEEKGINHNLITYTAEIGNKSHIKYIDVDQDGDDDILYSFAGDIYLKRNYLKNPEPAYFASQPELKKLSDLRPSAEAINYFEPSFVGNEEVEIAWDPSSAEDLLAYEMLLKFRFNDYDNESDTIGSIAHFVPQAQNQSITRERPAYFRFFIVHGWIEFDGQRYETNRSGDASIIKPGTGIETSEDLDTDIHLLAFNARDEFIGTMRVGPDTKWTVMNVDSGAAEFKLDQGEAILDFRQAENSFLQSGDEIVSGNARVLLLKSDNRSYLVNKGQSMTVPGDDRATMYVKNKSAFAQGRISGSPRFVSDKSLGTLTEGDQIHMLSDGTVQARFEGETLLELKLRIHDIYKVPSVLPVGTIFSLSSGKAEAIFANHGISNTPLTEGLAIMPGDFVSISNGSAMLGYTDSEAQVNVNKDQLFGLFTYSNPEKPEANVAIYNGNFYAQMRALTKDGRRGSGSKDVLIAPQSCGDKSAPYVSVGEDAKEVPVFKTVSLDASASFDAAGKITKYYADINLQVDSDGDGDPSNDKNQFSDLKGKMDNPVFTFGPYDTPGTHKVKIFAEDQSGNASGQEVSIKVFVPDIYLDESTANSGIISGYIDPPVADMPFSIIRDRKPPLSVFFTESSDENDNYFTDSNGEFTIDDLNYGGDLLVKDRNGNDVASVDAETGDISIINSMYRVEIWPARPPDFPTRAVLLGSDDRVMASFFIVPDLNNDTAIVENFDTSKKVVQIKTEDKVNFSFNKLPSNDARNPGASELVYSSEDKRILLVNSSGNIFSFDERVTLSLDPPVDGVFNIHIINVLFEGKIIAKVYIPGINYDSAMSPIPERDLYKIDVLGDVPIPSSSSSFGGTNSATPFADVKPGSKYFKAISELSQKGIIDGYNENGQTLYKPDQLIGRAEYTKILLNTLCIDPRTEAYQAPSPFFDIQHSESNLVWYYPFVKESFLQNFIQGYLGEKNSDGLAPFKPGNTISRAEAATIILSALDTLEIMNLNGIEPGEPWYAPYMDVAQNLTPYLVDPKANTQVFLLNSAEASAPNDQISRGDFAIMAQRVFNAYNCFEIDDDDDGMPSYWERKHGLDPFEISDAEKDPDNDGLSNRDEYTNGTDPFNPDTDGGCMMDGPEVDNGFNPFNDPDDDDPDLDGLSCSVEINVYKTDPYIADTDAGGVNDGQEVLVNKTDPLFGADDIPENENGFDDFKGDLPEGVYAIEESCRSCPCPSSLANAADIMIGDEFWAVISSPLDVYNIYKKSNSVTIKSLPNK